MALRFKDNCDKLMSLTKEANVRFEAYCDNYKIYRNLLSHLGTLLETYQKDIKNYVTDHDKFVLNKETVQQVSFKKKLFWLFNAQWLAPAWIESAIEMFRIST